MTVSNYQLCIRWSKITHKKFIGIILDLFMLIEVFYSMNLVPDLNYRFQITYKYTLNFANNLEKFLKFHFEIKIYCERMALQNVHCKLTSINTELFIWLRFEALNQAEIHWNAIL